MKCQICGAELNKPGDICNNCMNEILEDKRRKSECEYVINRKFIFLHQAGHYFETAVLLIIMFIASVYISAIPVYLFFFAIMLIAFFIRMYIKSQNLKASKCTCYQTEMVYEYKFFRKESKIIKYKDIKEINYSQSLWERFFNLGTLEINTNSGNIFQNGVQIDCIENVEEVFKNLRQIVNI